MGLTRPDRIGTWIIISRPEVRGADGSSLIKNRSLGLHIFLNRRNAAKVVNVVIVAIHG
jgi:hypothetical protein